MTDAPKDYLDAMLKAIVGVEIEITRLVGKRKLGQNKAAADIRGAGTALRARGNVEIGDAMLAHAQAAEEKAAVQPEPARGPDSDDPRD
jgi:transcriptional regulator